MPPKRGTKVTAKPVVIIEIPIEASRVPNDSSPLQSPRVQHSQLRAHQQPTPRSTSQQETQGEDLDEQDEQDVESEPEDGAQLDDGDQDEDHSQDEAEPQNDTKPKDGDKKQRRKGKRFALNTDYKVYVHQVLKNIDPDLSISKTAMQIMNDLLKDVEVRLSEEASNLNKKNKTATLNDWDFQAAARLIIPGQLGAQAVGEGQKAMVNFKESTGKDKLS